MKKVLIEDIVHFQSVEAFEDATNLVYEDLDNHELFKSLEQWHCPGDHDTNWHNYNDIDTNFLGHRYNNDWLLARHEQGLIIGLSRILEIKGGE